MALRLPESLACSMDKPYTMIRTEYTMPVNIG
jgi:hypothetical protein